MQQRRLDVAVADVMNFGELVAVQFSRPAQHACIGPVVIAEVTDDHRRIPRDFVFTGFVDCQSGCVHHGCRVGRLRR